MVEIAKALSREARILVMDEPTAALPADEVERLFERPRACGEGVGIVYISHRLEEVFRIADRITVLKDGRRVDTVGRGHRPGRSSSALMVGRDARHDFRRGHRAEIGRGAAAGRGGSAPAWSTT